MGDRGGAVRARWATATGDLPPLTAGQRRAFVGIAVVAAVVRIGWCLYAARPPGPVLHDPVFYRLYGEQLADGNGYRLPDGSPTAYYPVGYPLALAALFWLADLTPFGDIRTGLVAGLNIACQLVVVLSTFAVARRLVPGQRGAAAGLGAAALVALWPNLILHTAVTLSESLFLALLMGAVLAAVSGRWGGRRVGPTRLVLVGVLLGAATLVRPVTAPVFGVLLVVAVVGGAGWRPALGRVAVVTGCALAVLAPWVVRNAVVMDAAVLSTNTGDNLCMSRRVGGSGGFEFPNARCNSGPFDSLERPAYEVERDAHGRRLAFDFVREHPGEEVRQWWRRAVATFAADADAVAAVESYGSDPFLGDATRRALAAAANGWYAVVGVAAVVGAANLVRPRPGSRGASRWATERLLVLGTGIGVLMAPILTFGEPRFKVPAVPFAAVAVAVLAADLAGRHAGHGAVVASALTPAAPPSERTQIAARAGPPSRAARC